MSVGSPTAGTWSSSQWRLDNEFETDGRPQVEQQVTARRFLACDALPPFLQAVGPELLEFVLRYFGQKTSRHHQLATTRSEHVTDEHRSFEKRRWSQSRLSLKRCGERRWRHDHLMRYGERQGTTFRPDGDHLRILKLVSESRKPAWLGKNRFEATHLLGWRRERCEGRAGCLRLRARASDPTKETR